MCVFMEVGKAIYIAWGSRDEMAFFALRVLLSCWHCGWVRAFVPSGVLLDTFWTGSHTKCRVLKGAGSQSAWRVSVSKAFYKVAAEPGKTAQPLVLTLGMWYLYLGVLVRVFMVRCAVYRERMPCGLFRKSVGCCQRFVFKTCLYFLKQKFSE